jgi:cytidine deaminase
MNNEELIKLAASVISTKKMTSGELIGDVGCAVLSEEGKVFTGVCVGGQFCAETAALGAMITTQEYKFKKIVATWKNEREEVFVIPPCGKCRQLMRDIHEENLSSEVILDKNKTVLLKELLPYFDWWQKVSL